MKKSTHETTCSVYGLLKTVMAGDEGEIKLQFLLCGICESLPPSYVKLRSYLNIHISNLADRYNLKVFKNFRSRNRTCLYCYTPWSGETTSFKLFPSKKSKFSQTHSNEDEENKKTARLDETRNTLVLKCKVCSQKTSFSLIKKKPNEKVDKVEKNEIVKSVKKRKKKDKSCGLVINSKRKDSSLAKNVHKKKKRIENSKETAPTFSSCKSPQTDRLKLPKNRLNPMSHNSKNLMLNPYAVQKQKKFSKNKEKKLQRLRRAVKEENNLTMKTIKDFLTVI